VGRLARADGRFACQPKLLLLVARYAALYQEGNLEKGKKKKSTMKLVQ
jgi:hypothetical protein